MKKNLFWSLLAAVGLFAFAACDSGGEGPKNEEEKPNPPAETITLNGVSALGAVYDKWRIGNDVSLFQVAITSKPSSGTSIEPEFETPSDVLVLSLCAEVSDHRNPVLPAGTYKVVNTNTPADGLCLGGESSAYIKIESATSSVGEQIKSGTVEVAVSGSNYTITADLILAKGKGLKATYTGAFTAPLAPYSLHTQDVQMPLTGFVGNGYYSAKPFSDLDADFWEIAIMKQDQSELLDVMVVVPVGVSSPENGIPTGEYKVIVADSYQTGDQACAAGEIYIDKDDKAQLNMSWYLSIGADNKLMQTPIADGKMNIEKQDDTYTLTFDFLDDCYHPNKLTGTWSGKLTLLNAGQNIAQKVSAVANPEVKPLMPNISKLLR